MSDTIERESNADCRERRDRQQWDRLQSLERMVKRLCSVRRSRPMWQCKWPQCRCEFTVSMAHAALAQAREMGAPDTIIQSDGDGK